MSKILQSMKNILYGDSENEPVPELIAQLAQEIYNHDLLLLLLENITRIEFEARKDVVQIFNNLLRRQIGSRSPTIEYLCTKETAIRSLILGYQSQEIALNCGMMLRECVKFEPLTKIILCSEDFFMFFDFVELPTFDIASDAFATFKDLLTRHKSLVPEFLLTNYDKFFEKYTLLLNSTNYVTRRQSLKLLGEILLDRSNFEVMTRYISNTDNLKLLMNFLRDKSRNIQFEAFHVFKVVDSHQQIFVANPNKPKQIHDILLKNQDKLVNFLSSFHNERTDDEQFVEEKNFLIKQIQSLTPL